MTRCVCQWLCPMCCVSAASAATRQGTRNVVVEVTKPADRRDLLRSFVAKSSSSSYVKPSSNVVADLSMVAPKGGRPVTRGERHTLRPHGGHQQRDEALGTQLARAAGDHKEI